MRRSFLIPPFVLGLCVGLCGCGNNSTQRGRQQQEELKHAEELADIEERFQTSAEIAEHRAGARNAARVFLENHFRENCQTETCKIHGLHSSPAEGGTYRIAADVEIGQRREILKLEAIRFFSEEKEREPYWQVVLISASNERVIGDPVSIQRFKAPNARTVRPTAEAPAPVETTPSPTQP